MEFSKLSGSDEDLLVREDTAFSEDPVAIGISWNGKNDEELERLLFEYGLAFDLEAITVAVVL